MNHHAPGLVLTKSYGRTVVSHRYLKWQALDGLGYLIPFPLRRPHDFKFGTRLVLPLYDQSTVDKCRRVVEAGASG